MRKSRFCRPSGCWSERKRAAADAIVLTHGHSDHLVGAKPLAAATGAKTYGFRPCVNAEFVPDNALDEGDEVAGLTVVRRPGHAADHPCFARAIGFCSRVITSWDGPRRSSWRRLAIGAGTSRAFGCGWDDEVHLSRMIHRCDPARLCRRALEGSTEARAANRRAPFEARPLHDRHDPRCGLYQAPTSPAAPPCLIASRQAVGIRWTWESSEAR